MYTCNRNLGLGSSLLSVETIKSSVSVSVSVRGKARAYPRSELCLNQNWTGRQEVELSLNWYGLVRSSYLCYFQNSLSLEFQIHVLITTGLSQPSTNCLGVRLWLWCQVKVVSCHAERCEGCVLWSWQTVLFAHQIRSTGHGSPRLRWPSPRRPETWSCPASLTWTLSRTSVRTSMRCSR